MKIDFNAEDLELMNTLLNKEEAELKIEIHHSRNYDYKRFLKEREKQIKALQVRLTEHKKPVIVEGTAMLS